jgi:hypothetical protein
VRLSDEIVERLRPIFSRENLIAHALNLIRSIARENRKRVIRAQASRSGGLKPPFF